MVHKADSPLLCSTQICAERLFSTKKSRKVQLLRSSFWEFRSSYARRIGRCFGVPVVLSGLLAGPCIFVALPTAAIAQSEQRVVQGKVELSSGNMVKGAIVYIKNGKTLEVRSYISTADGSYRFGQLKPDADYTVWAVYQGKKSKERGVSSFDTKQVFNIVLRIGA